jgi:hypothetical protein
MAGTVRGALNHSTGEHYLNWGNDNTGQDSFRYTRIAAELASAELRDAIQSMFVRFAGQNGVTENDARILLMNSGLRHQRVLDRHRREELALLDKLNAESLLSEHHGSERR